MTLIIKELDDNRVIPNCNGYACRCVDGKVNVDIETPGINFSLTYNYMPKFIELEN